MESIKYENVMMSLKNTLFFLLAFSLLHCKGQTEKGVNYPKGKIMTTEKLNIDKYRKIITSKIDKGEYDDVVELLSDGSVIEYQGKNQYDIHSTLKRYPLPSLKETYKEYYSNGILKEETERFIGLSMNSDQIKFGTSKYYDETGQLIKTVDESVKYENIVVKPLELFEILKKEPLFRTLSQEEQAHFKVIFELNEKENEISPQLVHKALQEEFILNPYDRENAKRVFLSLSKDEKKWFVVKDIYPFGQISVEIDTKTGKIANREYKKEWRP